MTKEEYKAKSVSELEEELAQKKSELGSLAFNEDSSLNVKRQLRKDIARIQTFLRQKRNQEQ